MAEQLFAKVTEQPPDGSETLLLLHGFPFDHRMWQAQIEACSPVCRVIAPDLRGFGRSSIDAQAATAGVEMADYATDVVELLNTLQVETPVVVCGFSMGGYILWQFARRFPERVKALVLCDTRAAADSAEASAGRLQTALEVMQSGTESLVEGMLPKLLAAENLANCPKIVEKVAAMIHAASSTAVAAALLGMARRPDMQKELINFDWPALVLCGAEDAISPPTEMQSIAESLPQGRFSEIAQAGHLSPLENPTVLNEALLAFVKSL